jgi:hypothetical protein
MIRNLMPSGYPEPKIEWTCPSCNKIFILNRDQSWKFRHWNRKNLYCSRKCYRRIGTQNPKWRGGKTISKGYVYIYVPDHPFATHHGYVPEHRLAMEEKLGRFLLPEESIHHIDRNTMNNVPENLALFTKENFHRKHHIKTQKRNHRGQFISLH